MQRRQSSCRRGPASVPAVVSVVALAALSLCPAYADSPPSVGSMAESGAARQQADTQIAAILAKIQAAIADGHVTSPAGGNAVDMFASALTVLPLASPQGVHEMANFSAVLKQRASTEQAAGHVGRGMQFAIFADLVNSILASEYPTTRADVSPEAPGKRVAEASQARTGNLDPAPDAAETAPSGLDVPAHAPRIAPGNAAAGTAPAVTDPAPRAGIAAEETHRRAPEAAGTAAATPTGTIGFQVSGQRAALPSFTQTVSPPGGNKAAGTSKPAETSKPADSTRLIADAGTSAGTSKPAETSKPADSTRLIAEVGSSAQTSKPADSTRLTADAGSSPRTSKPAGTSTPPESGKPGNASNAVGGAPPGSVANAAASLPPPTTTKNVQIALVPPVTAPIPDQPVHSQSQDNVAKLPPEIIKTLMSRGDAMLALGDISAARRLYGLAAEAGNGEAAMRLGQTFDPEFLTQHGVEGLEPNPAAAAAWYRKAVKFGYTDATAWLAHLATEKLASTPSGQ